MSCISFRLSTSFSARITAFSVVLAVATTAANTDRRVVLRSDQIDGCTVNIALIGDSYIGDGILPSSRIGTDRLDMSLRVMDLCNQAFTDKEFFLSKPRGGMSKLGQ